MHVVEKHFVLWFKFQYSLFPAVRPKIGYHLVSNMGQAIISATDGGFIHDIHHKA